MIKEAKFAKTGMKEYSRIIWHEPPKRGKSKSNGPIDCGSQAGQAAANDAGSFSEISLAKPVFQLPICGLHSYHSLPRALTNAMAYTLNLFLLSVFAKSSASCSLLSESKLWRVTRKRDLKINILQRNIVDPFTEENF
jgi:hypothetical protein